MTHGTPNGARQAVRRACESPERVYFFAGRGCAAAARLEQGRRSRRAASSSSRSASCRGAPTDPRHHFMLSTALLPGAARRSRWIERVTCSARGDRLCAKIWRRDPLHERLGRDRTPLRRALAVSSISSTSTSARAAQVVLHRARRWRGIALEGTREVVARERRYRLEANRKYTETTGFLPHWRWTTGRWSCAGVDDRCLPRGPGAMTR